MRPSHPCLLCGHATSQDCERAAEELAPRYPAQCVQCGCECQPGGYRGGGPGISPAKHPDGRTPAPGDLRPHVPSPDRAISEDEEANPPEGK